MVREWISGNVKVNLGGFVMGTVSVRGCKNWGDIQLIFCGGFKSSSVVKIFKVTPLWRREETASAGSHRLNIY